MSNAFQVFKKFARKPDDTEDLAFEKLLILVVALCCSICGLIWFLIYFLVFGIGLTALLPLSFVLIVGATIIISHRMADHRPLIYAQLACITWISALIQWTIGSMDHSGLVILWSFLGPLGAVIFLSFRQSLLWMFMFLVIVVISAVYEPAILGKQLFVTDQVKTLFYIMNLGAASIVVFAASAWSFKTIQFERSRSETLLQKIKTLFGQHVSTEIANELISNPDATAESKPYEVTTMFLDIRDFTTYADVRSPKEVANIQNTLFVEYITLVKEHKGIVLQLLGDGLMAVFGAPIVTLSHPVDAVQAALSMIEITASLYESGQIPNIKVGIGLHTGKVIAGEIGNQSRKFYSITGTNVIIASRIEQLNKVYNSQILISGAVEARIKDLGLSPTPLGGHELKGISALTDVYRIA